MVNSEWLCTGSAQAPCQGQAGIPVAIQLLCRAVSMAVLQPLKQVGNVISKVLLGAGSVLTLVQLQHMLAMLCGQLWRTSFLFPTLLLALPPQLDQLHNLQRPVNFLGLVCFPTPIGSWSSWLLPHCTGPGLVPALV